MARNKPEKIEPDTHLSSHEVGAMLQCNPSSVNKWVKEGKIIAHRTPGGHRRMRAADVVAFLCKYEMPVPPELTLAAPSIASVPEVKPRPLRSPPSVFVFPVAPAPAVKRQPKVKAKKRSAR